MLASMDSLDTILMVVVFLCLVASFPHPEELQGMTFPRIAYTVLYRFFNQLSVNMRVIPGVGSIVQQVETVQSSSAADGSSTRMHSIETKTAAPTPGAVTNPPQEGIKA